MGDRGGVGGNRCTERGWLRVGNGGEKGGLGGWEWRRERDVFGGGIGKERK